MQISDYIASLTNFTRSSFFNDPLYFKHRDILEKMIETYAYFRDKHGIKTKGKLLENLSKRKFNPKIIEFLIKEKRLMGLKEISEGYPEHKKELQELDEKYKLLESSC